MFKSLIFFASFLFLLGGCGKGSKEVCTMKTTDNPDGSVTTTKDCSGVSVNGG